MPLSGMATMRVTLAVVSVAKPLIMEMRRRGVFLLLFGRGRSVRMRDRGQSAGEKSGNHEEGYAASKHGY